MNSCINLLSLIAGLLTLCSSADAAKPIEALVGAHAHNDYYHRRPLLDALERGFLSIEADVFLVDGQLLVGHYTHELRPDRTLQALYLNPLANHVEANGGRVFKGDERLILLIDFKTEGSTAYAALALLLQEYEGIFSEMHDGRFKSGAVDVIITGNRPVSEIARDKSRRVAVDGRLADSDAAIPPDIIPLVSESWTDHFSWRGRGPMPGKQRERLQAMVQKIHAQGRHVRFWATPDDPVVWSELQRAKVDLIGADNLDALHSFLTSDRKED
jgi:hypothetical protein